MIKITIKIIKVYLNYQKMINNFINKAFINHKLVKIQYYYNDEGKIPNEY